MNTKTDNSTSTIAVFVYGTLKRGHGNHRLLETSTRLGEAVTADACYRMGDTGGFPEVTRNGLHAIAGEVYEVSTATLESLDRLEGNGQMYVREQVDVQLSTGECLTAWIYLWQLRRCDEILPDMDNACVWKGR